MPRILVVIPTYNEAENIGRLLPVVLRQAEGIDVLVVDSVAALGKRVKSMRAAPGNKVQAMWFETVTRA